MSQSVLVQCPHCRAEGNLADPALFGKAISCPVCQQIFTAPMPATSEPPVVAAAVSFEPSGGPTTEAPPAAVESAPVLDVTAETPAVATPPMADAVIPEVATLPLTSEGEGLPTSVESVAPSATAGAAAPEPVASPSAEEASTAPAVPVDVEQPAPETIAAAPDAASSEATPQIEVATAPAAQAVPVGETIAQPFPTAVAVPAPVVAAIPVAMPAAMPTAVATASPVASPAAIAVAAPLPLQVPGTPDTMAPVGPVTFPGQVAAFPTQVELPQDGVFTPPVATHTFDGPLPAFLAPAAAPGAEETSFAQSLPDPTPRGSVKPPKVRSKSTQTIIVSTITVILLFATVMFLMGDPSRRFGKKPKSKEPEEDNPIARPLDSGPADQSIEDVFARINAASKSGDTKKDDGAGKEKK